MDYRAPLPSVIPLSGVRPDLDVVRGLEPDDDPQTPGDSRLTTKAAGGLKPSPPRSFRKTDGFAHALKFGLHEKQPSPHARAKTGAIIDAQSKWKPGSGQPEIPE